VLVDETMNEAKWFRINKISLLKGVKKKLDKYPCYINYMFNPEKIRCVEEADEYFDCRYNPNNKDDNYF
jgi:hypothetical protein